MHFGLFYALPPGRRQKSVLEGTVRFALFEQNGRTGLAAVDRDGGFHALMADQDGYPGDLASLIAKGGDALGQAHRRLLSGSAVDPQSIKFLPPLPAPGKIVCMGLNYADHSAESGYEVPSYPTIFGRFTTSLIGHNAPIVRPRVSGQLDWEGEFVAVIGKGGRDISKASALDHVVGYSLFNDASIRDYQFKTPQWTVGKNFDATGPFGPYFVTADELPPGCAGLRLRTRLNGEVMQDASTDDLIFDVATMISLLSEAFTFETGDIIVTGTPSGIGLARKPPVWMKPGDVCTVEMDGLGVLSNPIVDQE